MTNVTKLSRATMPAPETSAEAFLERQLAPHLAMRRTMAILPLIKPLLPAWAYRVLSGERHEFELRSDLQPELNSADAVRLAGILPSEAAIRLAERELLAAATGEASRTEIAAIVGGLLGAKPSLKAEERTEYIHGLIFVLRFESECEPFSAAALAIAFFTIVKEQKFLPDAAEIIPRIAEAQTRLVLMAKRMDMLADIRHAVDEVLLGEGWTFEQLGIPSGEDSECN